MWDLIHLLHCSYKVWNHLLGLYSVLYQVLLSYLLNVNNHVKSTILQFQFLLLNRQNLVELGQANMGWLSGATQIWIEEYFYLSMSQWVQCQEKSCPCSKACLTCMILTNSHFCTSRQYMLLTDGRNSLWIFHSKSKNVACMLGALYSWTKKWACCITQSTYGRK